MTKKIEKEKVKNLLNVQFFDLFFCLFSAGASVNTLGPTPLPNRHAFHGWVKDAEGHEFSQSTRVQLHQNAAWQRCRWRA